MKRLIPDCRFCGKPRGRHSVCNACHTKARRIRCKAKAVALLGGKCNRCGWSGDMAAFEFHHKDGTEKEFQIGNVSNKAWDSIVEELAKCELICSNCHRIEHTNRSEEFLEYALGKVAK